jgi:hypothetical protein
MFILCFLFQSCEKVEAQKISQQEIQEAKILINNKLQEIYAQQTNSSDTLFKVDPRLTTAVEILSSDTFKIQIPVITDEEIRKLLRKYGIIDYQVHYLRLPPQRNLKTTTINNLVREHSSLNKILRNPFSNRYGIDIKSKNDNYLVHLLIVEHYIDFGQIAEASAITFGNQNVFLWQEIFGKSLIERLFYNSVNQDFIQDSIKLNNTKREIELDSINAFAIKVKEKNIYFMNEEGKILARSLKF